jgi:glycosyltransferase involved in cell wall biosynthesis
MTSISVVIPSYNDAAMLAQVLGALGAQSRPADEIVVVNNGSTDATATVARDAGALVVDEPLRGIFAATSAGFDAAGCDVIARLDADSIPPTDWLQRIEAAFTRDRELTAITGPGRFYGGHALTHWLGETFYIGGYFWSMSILLGHAPLFGSNFAMRADAWRRVRGSVHRTVREVHDDLDLSFHLEPDMRVLYDESLVVQVSARPFRSLSTFGRRINWAFGTIALNARERSPIARRAERREWEQTHSAETANGDDEAPASA